MGAFQETTKEKTALKSNAAQSKREQEVDVTKDPRLGSLTAAETGDLAVCRGDLSAKLRLERNNQATEKVSKMGGTFKEITDAARLQALVDCRKTDAELEAAAKNAK